MSRYADRLVDHHDVVVVVHDDDTFDLLRAHLGEPRLIGELHLEHRPDADPIGLVDRGTVQQHAPRADQLRDPAPGQPEHPRHGSINPLAVQSIRDEQHFSLSHERSCSDHDHRRLRTTPDRAWRSPVMPIPLTTDKYMIMMAAAVMHMSATLKIGQYGSSRKSITWPRSTPGGRNSRSVRFPATPAHSSPMATAQAGMADPRHQLDDHEAKHRYRGDREHVGEALTLS